jgi:hypothetical protein
MFLIRKNHILIVSIALLVIILSACTSAANDAPTFPTGRFVTKSSQFEGYLFNEDMTWAYLVDGSIAAEGKYSVKGNQWIEQGTAECPFPGTYEWTFDGTNLSFKVVDEDECDPRRESTDGKTFLLQQ